MKAVKFILMSLEELRKEVQDFIANKADDRFLRLVNGMIKEDSGIVAYTVNGEPLTKEAYNQKILEGEQQIKDGKFSTMEELEQEVKNW